MVNKRYREININNVLFGPNYKIYGYKENDEKIEFFLKSRKRDLCCPCCNHSSKRLHSTYTRIIQTLPMRLKTTWINISAYKYRCDNPLCNCHVFMEPLDFASPHQVKSDELISVIIAISAYVSNEGASKILGCLGIKTSNDGIKRLFDHIVIEDNFDVSQIGVDDVATRKGQKYATAIYDMNDKHMIALLDGRDGQTFKEWLIKHPKITKVTRDRASSYASAIEEILPNCIQIADRFHLLQNLLDYLNNVFKNEMPYEIYIKDDEIIEDSKEAKGEAILVDKDRFKGLDYDSSPPVDENGEVIQYIHSLADKSSFKKEREVKQELIRKVKKRWIELDGVNHKQETYNIITSELHVTAPTIRDYIKMDEQDVINIQSFKDMANYKRRSSVAEYQNMIYKMLKDNVPTNTIFLYVLYKGFKGTYSALNNCINMMAKNNFGLKTRCRYKTKPYIFDVVVIKRKDILKEIAIRNPKIEHDKTIQKYWDKLIDKYPIIPKIKEIYDDFYEGLMGKDVTKMERFIDKNETKKGEDKKKNFMHNFVESIKKDITPIKNAISSVESSGFVEGNNNKFKLIKRILFGKAKTNNLFKKCYICFLFKTKDFDIKELVKFTYKRRHSERQFDYILMIRNNQNIEITQS